jgi:hypothetical protein
MHDLTVRNQEDALAPGAKEKLFAHAKVGTLVSLLKSKARRILGVKPQKRITSSGAHGGSPRPANLAAGPALLRLFRLHEGR